MSKYRGKKCLECGGTMQYGGTHPLMAEGFMQMLNGYKGHRAKQSVTSKDNIQDTDVFNSNANKVGSYVNEQYIADPRNNLNIDPFFAMRSGMAGLTALSGGMERGRQNEYMQSQLSALGQMNPVPVEQFQPNYYDMYMKHGGKVKNIYRGRNRKFTNNAEFDMGVYQKGGSVYDFMTSKGMDGSYKNRKKIFDEYFDGKYKGTAEQNTQLLKTLQGSYAERQQPQTGRASRPAPQPSRNQPLNKSGKNILFQEDRQLPLEKGVKYRPAKRIAEQQSAVPLESGVVVDKRTGQAFVMQGNKPVKSFDVLTGNNVEGNVVSGALGSYGAGAATPVGAYMLDPNSSFADQYNGNIMDMNPIAMPGQPTPNIGEANLGFHQTYEPWKRDSLYGGAKPWVSSGCVNGDCRDVKDIMNRFPQGDTMMVIDSKMPQYQNMYKQLRGNKRR